MAPVHRTRREAPADAGAPTATGRAAGAPAGQRGAPPAPGTSCRRRIRPDGGDDVSALRAWPQGSRPLGPARIRQLAGAALALAEPDGRAGAALADELQAIERHCTFTARGSRAFQQLLATLGVISVRPIGLPLDDTPYWLRDVHPLANYQSGPELPAAVDVLVIGAGLTGASAAYHLGEPAALAGRRIAVVDQGDPACEASGRNAGHFETLPENSVGIYEGIARERLRFLQRLYPALPPEVLQAEAERQASIVLGFALRNRNRLREIIRCESIECDFEPRGWIYLAHTDPEEQGLCEEVVLAAQQGERIELWSRAKIREELGFKTGYLGRFVPGDGSFHPFKYACGLLQRALQAGVKLYTRARVQSIESVAADRHRIHTDRGTVVAGSVILATNAFTRTIVPELAMITPRQSQIMVTEHAPDRTRGRIVTTEYGPAYFNQPRSGAHDGRAPLLMGGGADRAMRNPFSRRRSPEVHAELLRLRDAFYPELRGQPCATEWVGPMGFTPDQLPAIGFLRPGVVVAAGYNGYGGSYTTAAGQAAAHMAITGEVPQWVPEDVFSPRRLLSRTPLFMSEHDSLWRIAASLCRQLRTVNRELGDTLNQVTPDAVAAHTALADCDAPGESTPLPVTIDPEALRRFPALAAFSQEQMRELLVLAQRHDARAGTVLFEEGSPGGSCYILVHGAVEVWIAMGKRRAPVATLPPGSIFGQVSLIEGTPRTATCIASGDCVLLEVGRAACEGLFATRSDTALRFLAALNEGLISDLRQADRRLLRLLQEGRLRWTPWQTLPANTGAAAGGAAD